MNRRIAAVLLISFLLLALSYSVTVPPFEAPDEVGHFYFSFHLLTKAPFLCSV
jgi:hypothetical protein